MLEKFKENRDMSVKSEMIQVTGFPKGSVLPSMLWILETNRSHTLLQGQQPPSHYKDSYRQLAPPFELPGACIS